MELERQGWQCAHREPPLGGRVGFIPPAGRQRPPAGHRGGQGGIVGPGGEARGEDVPGPDQHPDIDAGGLSEGSNP